MVSSTISNNTVSGKNYYSAGVYCNANSLTIIDSNITSDSSAPSNFKNSGNIFIDNNYLTDIAINISDGNTFILNNSTVSKANISISSESVSILGNTLSNRSYISFYKGDSFISDNLFANTSVSISGGNVSISDNTIDNTTILISKGRLSIFDSSLASGDNINISGGESSISNCSFTGSAFIAISGGKTSIINSSLKDGAYITINGGKTSVLDCSIVGSGSGKGINITNGNIDTSISVTNSIIRNFEYGIYTKAQINSTIINSSITNNSTYGICVENSSAVFNICNSIISKNALLADIYKSGATINAYNSLSTFTDWSNGYNNYFYDSSLPLFKDANNSDYRLAENSQAINKGNNSYAVDESSQPLTTDLAGIPRIIGGTVDLGAYEYDSRTALSTPEFSVVPNRTFAVVIVSPVENASAYTIEYSLNDDFTGSTTIDAQEGENTLEDLQESQTYYVRIKSVGNNDYADSEYSASQSFVTVPTLTGLTLSTDSPTVGTTITTTLAPIGATASYQWYCGETEITGATDSSFKVTEAQISKTITCVATGTGDYFGTVSATTAETVPALPLDTPVLSSLNANNTVVVANWSLIDNADSYTFEYQLDGSENWTITTGLQGTSTAFIGNIGSTYNVRVKANGTGNYSDSPYSEIASITLTVPPTPLSGLTLSTNSPEVGTTITTTLAPSDATADYQWYSGETTIEGATESSFTVTEDQIGQTITCVATGTGEYSGTASATTAVVPAPIVDLDVPAGLALSAAETTVTAAWSAVENASSYTMEYQAADSDAWTTIPDVQGTSASFSGVAGTTYNVRVKANGTGNYTDSEYSEIEQITLDEVNKPIIAVNGKKISVLWTDASLAADSVRYRVAGTNKWTVKKLKEGVTEFSFNGALGTTYDIEVLLDQQENNVLRGSATVLDQPKLKADKAFLKDDTFQVSVTNYAAKNLSTNAKQAIVIVNGVQTTFNIENQEGSAELTNGGSVAFANGLFTFTEMNCNTSYKVQIAFSDGVSYSTLSSALTVKTTKACYLAPVITTAHAVSDTSIIVTWETALGKHSNTPAQKYTVQYSLDGNKWSNATTAATGNAYTIQKLKGGNVYQVRVLATKDNAFEASVPSDVLTAETLAAPKTAIEKNSITDDSFQLNVSNYRTTNLVNATSITVKSDQFGEAVINLEDGSGSAAFDNGMTVALNDGALTFANAPSNTQQKVQVNFSDGVCTTAWSAALTVKTAIASYSQPVLSAPTVVSSTSVLVEWSPAVGKNTDIQAQSYTVQYSTDGNRWTNANTKVVGTSFTITGLKTGTTYLVAVIANKDARFNASQPSESLEVRML